jgi:hypothetical protein
MKRTPLRRGAKLRARKPLRRTKPLQRTPSLAATEAQRAAVAGRPCIACGATHRIDPAHLIPRSLGVAATRSVSYLHAGRVTARTTPASSTCCRIWSPDGGRSSRTPSGMSGMSG